MDSARIVLPAPVSPVIALRPGAKSSSASRMSTRFSMRSRLSTGQECCTGSEARRNAYVVGVSRPTTATSVRRHPERGAYERETIDAILDEARICHVGFVHEGRPFVIPTIHARSGETLYVHGSPASRMLRTLSEGIDVCVTVTLLDGIVLARSVYNHSMNYRSALVLG